MEISVPDVLPHSSRQNSILKKINPKTLSKKLKLAARSGEIDLALCLEAANFIDGVIDDQANSNNESIDIEYSDAEFQYLISIILKIRRKSHQTILICLMRNAGKIVSTKDMCTECNSTYSTFKVQISHLRSELKNVGALNLIQSIRTNSICTEGGYIIMKDEMQKIRQKYFDTN